MASKNPDRVSSSDVLLKFHRSDIIDREFHSFIYHFNLKQHCPFLPRTVTPREDITVGRIEEKNPHSWFRLGTRFSGYKLMFWWWRWRQDLKEQNNEGQVLRLFFFSWFFFMIQMWRGIQPANTCFQSDRNYHSWIFFSRLNKFCFSDVLSTTL